MEKEKRFGIQGKLGYLSNVSDEGAVYVESQEDERVKHMDWWEAIETLAKLFAAGYEGIGVVVIGGEEKSGTIEEQGSVV